MIPVEPPLSVGDEQGRVLRAGNDLGDLFTRDDDPLEDLSYEAPFLYRRAQREEPPRVTQVSRHAVGVDRWVDIDSCGEHRLQRPHLLLIATLIDVALRVQSLPSVYGEPKPPRGIRVHGLLPGNLRGHSLDASAAARFRDDSIDISDCGEKVRALIAEYIGASGIERLLEPVSILSPRFDEEVEKLENTDARASEMEHAIRHELKIRFEENPAFYQTLRQRLEQILAERRLERISSAEELKRLRSLAQELRSVSNIAQSMGLTETSFAIYELLLQEQEPDPNDALRVAESPATYHTEIDEPKRELAALIDDDLRRLAVIDWRTKDDVQREMRRQIKRQLRAAGTDGDRLDAVTSTVLDVARRGLPQ